MMFVLLFFVHKALYHHTITHVQTLPFYITQNHHHTPTLQLLGNKMSTNIDDASRGTRGGGGSSQEAMAHSKRKKWDDVPNAPP